MSSDGKPSARLESLGDTSQVDGIFDVSAELSNEAIKTDFAWPNYGEWPGGTKGNSFLPGHGLSKGD